MKTKLFRCLVISVLFIAVLGCSKASKEFPSANNEELSFLIGNVLVWENYWYGCWEKEFKAFMGAKKQMVSIAYDEKEKCYQVFVDELKTNLPFYKYDQWRVIDIQDYNDPRSTEEANRGEYESNKKNFDAVSVKKEISFSGRSFEVVKFDPFSAEKRQLIEKLFLEKVFSGDARKFIFDQLKQRTGKTKIVRLKVGNFKADYPWLYYYVEGIPYVGRVFYDTTTKKGIYEEMISIEETPMAAKYLNIKKRIDETGMVFKYEDDKFVR